MAHALRRHLCCVHTHVHAHTPRRPPTAQGQPPREPETQGQHPREPGTQGGPRTRLGMPSADSGVHPRPRTPAPCLCSGSPQTRARVHPRWLRGLLAPYWLREADPGARTQCLQCPGAQAARQGSDLAASPAAPAAAPPRGPPRVCGGSEGPTGPCSSSAGRRSTWRSAEPASCGDRERVSARGAAGRGLRPPLLPREAPGGVR